MGGCAGGPVESDEQDFCNRTRNRHSIALVRTIHRNQKDFPGENGGRLGSASGCSFTMVPNRLEGLIMVLSLFAQDGRSDVLALAPNRECLPDPDRWSLREKGAIDIGKLMLDQQRAIRQDGFILGTRRS